MLCFLHAFILLAAYYVLKTLREPLLLANGSAETKSYAYAVIAVSLFAVVPVYGFVYRRTEKDRLAAGLTALVVVSLGVFLWLGRSGTDIGFVYYVWVGVAGVTLLAQFWAHAADLYDVESGQRLLPAIMAGATLGGLAGPLVARYSFQAHGPWMLMALAMGLLACTLPLVAASRKAVPAGSRNPCTARRAPVAHKSAFSLVLNDRYLLLLACLAVLLNCVNTMGEFILTGYVVDFAEQLVLADPSVDRQAFIAAFYGNFYLTINVLAVCTQTLLVARLFRRIGIAKVVLLLPVIALIGYGLIIFLPILAIVRWVKIIENCADYSIMNTARHTLFLPLASAARYQGKVTTDAFFWRLGDLLQAGIVFAGLNWLGYGYREFAALNIALGIVWLGVSFALGRRYSAMAGARGHASSQARAKRIPNRRRVFDPARPCRRVKPAPVSAATALLLVFGLSCLLTPTSAQAGTERLFDSHDTLELEIRFDPGALCRDPYRPHCEDAPATIVYLDASGDEVRVSATLRSRGRYREQTGNCRLPALFVYFGPDTRGTLFDGQSMLPLTTHCQRGAKYDQYVLKEYLAYRIYNLLTDKSLRVRLARVTYRDESRPDDAHERFAFFTEHFEAMARRNEASVWQTELLDPGSTDPEEMAAFDLFQYLIGNTDWSVLAGHNVVLVRDAAGLVTPVPYDFDFSGLVNAEYAGPPPKLNILSVRQRVFRGFCSAELEWPAVSDSMLAARDGISTLLDRLEGLDARNRKSVAAYLGSFFETLESPRAYRRRIADACRVV